MRRTVGLGGRAKESEGEPYSAPYASCLFSPCDSNQTFRGGVGNPTETRVGPSEYTREPALASDRGMASGRHLGLLRSDHRLADFPLGAKVKL